MVEDWLQHLREAPFDTLMHGRVTRTVEQLQELVVGGLSQGQEQLGDRTCGLLVRGQARDRALNFDGEVEVGVLVQPVRVGRS